MLRRLLWGAAVCALCLPAHAWAGDAGIYGDGVRVDKPTPIEAILADPDAWVGKTVRVEGRVLDVCPRKGCWIDLGDDERQIRIKVEDDVIVFPAAARGRLAAAEGVVEAIEMTRDQHLAWLAHVAEERGEEFDEDAAEIGDGPFRMIRIRGTGARIE